MLHFDALDTALPHSLETSDRIPLLGEPRAGEEIDPDNFSADVCFWNRERKVIGHTVSIGTRSRLMRDVAEMTGGVHVLG